MVTSGGGTTKLPDGQRRNAICSPSLRDECVVAGETAMTNVLSPRLEVQHDNRGGPSARPLTACAGALVSAHVVFGAREIIVQRTLAPPFVVRRIVGSGVCRRR